jgi:crotonobetainyl-CoA:carnitine CoA-transferase CaiB-like acyl-CoA transferase
MLESLRVLDMSRVLAGPLCGMILGDLGADVLKVERPGTGDETRTWGPPFDERGESAYYLSINRNKLGVALDLASATDRESLERLVAQADVVIDNFRVGTLERYGLAPSRLLAEHAGLVWCTLTGFGPDSRRPGYDFVVQAESGWMSITGEPEGEPMKSGVALADVLAGKDAAIAILGALAGRGLGRAARSVGDRHLFVSLAHSATSALVNVAQNTLVSGTEARRWGNAHANLVPYQLFRAADRHLVVAVGSDAQWLACCRALELHDLAGDAALRTNAGRLANRERIVARFAERLLERETPEWLDRLVGEAVPCGVVRSVREVLEGTETSALTGIAPARPGTVRFAPPRLDEHGALIRARGWDAFRDVASITRK